MVASVSEVGLAMMEIPLSRSRSCIGSGVSLVAPSAIDPEMQI